MKRMLVPLGPRSVQSSVMLDLEEDRLDRIKAVHDGYPPPRRPRGETLPERLQRLLGRPIDFSLPAQQVIAQFPSDLRPAVAAAWPKRIDESPVARISADTRDFETRERDAEYARQMMEPPSQPFSGAGPVGDLVMLLHLPDLLLGRESVEDIAQMVRDISYIDEAVTSIETGKAHLPSEPGRALREPPAIMRRVNTERGMAGPSRSGTSHDVQVARGVANAPRPAPKPSPVVTEAQASLARAAAEMVRANRTPVELSAFTTPRSDPEGLRTWLDAYPNASAEQVRNAERTFGASRAEARDPVRDPIAQDIAPAAPSRRRASGGRRKAQEPTHERLSVSDAQAPQLGRIIGRAMMSPRPLPVSSPGDALREELGQLWREVVAEKHGTLAQMAERLLPQLAGLSNSEANEVIRKVAYEPVRSTFVRRLFAREDLRLRLQDLSGLHMEPEGAHSPYIPAEALDTFREAVLAKSPQPGSRSLERLTKVYLDFDHEVPIAKIVQQLRATRNPRWLELAADPRYLRLVPRLENQRVLNSPHLLQWEQYADEPDYPGLL